LRSSPLVFRLAKGLVRRKIAGGYRLLTYLVRSGLLDVVVEHSLGRDVVFGIPVFRAENCWDRQDLLEYESRLVDCFCHDLDLLSDVVLFDCGADIGTFTALVCSRVSCVSRVIAFEPNPEVTAFLRQNLSRLGIPAEMFAKAVGSAEGWGRLVNPDYDSSDHARFFAAGEGPLEVATVDSMRIRRRNIGLKIDVEGGELDVLVGAKETIASAQNCVICFEVHPSVLSRTGIDPNGCFEFLRSLRPFEFMVAETGERISSLALIKEGRPINLVASTRQS
jgi:FkbM family methyltransferase